MEALNRRSYRGPVRLAVFDYAGTTVDYGCMAPAAVFVEGFRRQGIEITMTQAREPMGMEKRAHIKTIGAMPAVAQEWQAIHGQPITDADIDAMYDDFVSLLLDVLEGHSGLIPGTLETIETLRARQIKIAGTTGYFPAAVDVVRSVAEQAGYRPDFSLGATEVKSGRPAPWMIFRTMEELAVYPPEAVVKIGDTRVDIESGLNAGVWTIGVAQTGNEVGLSQAEIEALAPAERQAQIDAASASLTQAGAHFVVDGIWAVPEVIAEIAALLRAGERP